MSDILNKKHDLVAFRAAIRSWLKANCPPAHVLEEIEASAGVDHAKYAAYQQAWMAELNEVGLATPHWPEEYGGAGLTLKHRAIIADEMARANAPRLWMYVVSLNQVPGTLLAWGTEAQKRRYLPGVAQGVVWCQGFSEPGSGSDLASLRTKAERIGDEYVINGQKIWTSQGMHAKYCILLARTSSSGKKQTGISYFIMDMKAPGVAVRPIRQATGRAEFSELFLENVRIPLEARIGEENQGWTVAQATLASERGVIGFEEAERFRYSVEDFYRTALQEQAAWLSDNQQLREFMRLLARLQALRGMIRELLELNERTPDVPTIAPSVVKIVGTTLEQNFFEFQTRIKGLQAQYMVPGPAERGEVGGNPLLDYIDSFGHTIAGGANEIQRNIIAERGLGMPRA